MELYSEIDSTTLLKQIANLQGTLQVHIWYLYDITRFYSVQYTIDKFTIYRKAFSDNGYLQTDNLTFINMNNNPLELSYID